ncbi:MULTISPECIES: hypothetical protein [unclassified Pseudomonas]|uniref:hypothetical protein n=1 Tax=unclassified Pseudomonas TaxID=196821 RepID=UPI002AC8B6B9|nr:MULTISPECIES: hypothetical protein [unclassified Pseudomonas]MEB0046899.1 hypothetical protein [Pseudomonas sp. Dout3]MEB0098625.1 hypothetical protein [Pseudomonas sp. DC1.2]WPX59591.1 hypothetical protein RHM68_02745 [Pseudomonas sp. DC1.2]
MTLSWLAGRGWRQALLIIFSVFAVCWAIDVLSDDPEIALEMGGTYEDLHKRSSASFSPLIRGHSWSGIPATDARLRFIDPQYAFVTPLARFFAVGFDDNVIRSIRMSPQVEPLLLDDALKVALDLQEQWRQGGWRVAGPRIYPPFADTPAWRTRLQDVNLDGKTYWKAGEKYQVAMYMNRFKDDKRPNEERYLITLSIGKPWTSFDADE